MSPELMTYAIAGLAFVAIAGLGLSFAGPGRGKQNKRMKSISDGGRTGRAVDANAARRKQMDALANYLEKQADPATPLIIAGDFTHSTANKELELFLKWRKDFSLLHIDLVKGNHDILADSWYTEAGINVHEWKLAAGPFLFLHDKKAEKDLTEEERVLYRFTGHLHPAITLRGKGKQSLWFPCFYFTKETAVLPAFSRFTGGFKVEPQKGEQVFALVEDGIMQLT